MIRTKQELKFYLMADRMMNTGRFKPTIKQMLYELIGGGSILRYLKHLRCCEYYMYHNKILYYYHLLNYRRLGRNLGFSIGFNTLGYGVVIPHFGTIVVGSPARIGNYCVLHTSTCITGNKKLIGDGFYLSTGAKITSPILLGDNISVGANSVVNKDFPKGNAMIAGAPAREIKPMTPWWRRDGEYYSSLHDACEKLRERMKI